MTVNEKDDFLYEKIIRLLGQIKLVQGASAIAPTIRRHRFRRYLIMKQKSIADELDNYFSTDGDVDRVMIDEYYQEKRRKQILIK